MTGKWKRIQNVTGGTDIKSLIKLVANFFKKNNDAELAHIYIFPPK
jgi:hypothetical protein